MKNSLLTKSARCARMQIALLLAALVLVFLLSFSLGRYDVPVGQVVKILISRVFPIEASWTKNMEIAVLNVRLPRILLVCMVGCCLAMAGASYQSVFRIPWLPRISWARPPARASARRWPFCWTAAGR